MSDADTNQRRFGKRTASLIVVAIAACAGMVAMLQSSEPSHLERARQAVADGSVATAEDAFRAHLEENRGDSAVRLEFAVMLKAVNAEVAFQQLQLIPADADEYTSAQRHIAHISLLSGKDNIAQAALEHVIGEAPDDFAAVLSLAELYFRTAQFEKALPITRRVVEQQPERARSHLLLAEVLDGLKRPGEMLAPLEKASRIDPDDYDTRSLLAYALHFSGQLDEAERHARWCLDRQPNDATPWRILASVSRDRSERDLAMEQIDRALELDPSNLWSQVLKADLLLFAREAEPAWQLLEPLYREHHTEREFLASMARAAAMTGRTEEARRLQKEIVRLMDEPSTSGPAAPDDQPIPKIDPGEEYASSAACQKCHPGEFDSWHRTYHRTMTQLASPESVKGTFANVTIESRGRQYRLSRDGDRFLVEMADPDWEREQLAQRVDVSVVTDPPIVTREVVLATGSHHFQQYWVTSRYGSALNNLPLVFDIEEQRWMPREDAFLAPPDGYRHFKVWNVSCIGCHSVGGRPGYAPASGNLDSRVVEFGIACESCHGPAAEHIRLHESRDDNTVPLVAGTTDPILNPVKASHRVASEVCGQCHSTALPPDVDEWLQDGSTYRPGESLSDALQVLKHGDNIAATDSDKAALNSLFWPDGTSRVGGREYPGLIESPCFQRGEMSCLSCHSMHSSEPDNQLAAGMDSKRGCLQCHAEIADDIEAHTHHAADSSGSQCYNCHMPYTSFALLKAARSHRIDSPNVVTRLKTGRPVACNQCHLDRPLDWTAQHLAEWYGHDVPAEELSEEHRSTSDTLLMLLRGDAMQRALASWTMSWQPALEASGRDWQATFLARLLEDPYSAVRYVSGRSLKQLPGFEEFQYDFVADSDVRAASVNQATAIATEGERPSNRRLSEILFQDDGSLMTDRIELLMRDRNDRPIELPE